MGICTFPPNVHRTCHTPQFPPTDSLIPEIPWTHRYEPLTTRLKFGERRFSYTGPRAWNSLPHAIQERTDSSIFKHKLNTHSLHCDSFLPQVTLGHYYGRRAFSVAGPAIWNWLPDSLRDPAISRDLFKRSLTTFLFSAYS